MTRWPPCSTGTCPTRCRPGTAFEMRRRAPVLLDFDEDALSGALFGGLDDRFFLPGGHVGQAFGATRVAEDLLALLDVGEPVVEQGEHVGGDLLAEAVAGAEILIDPDLHGRAALLVWAPR